MTHCIIGLDHDPFDGTYGHIVYHGPYDAFIHDRNLLASYLHEQWYSWLLPRLQEQLSLLVSDPDITVLYAPEPVPPYNRLYTEHEQIRDMAEWKEVLINDIYRELDTLLQATLDLDDLYDAWCLHIDRYMEDFAFDPEYSPSRRAYVCQEACLPSALRSATPEEWQHWHDVIQNNIDHTPFCS